MVGRVVSEGGFCSNPLQLSRDHAGFSVPIVSSFKLRDVSHISGTLLINGPSGHITGVEASWEQHLAFLPGLLNGFGVALNYSYTSSQVTFPAGGEANREQPESSWPQRPSGFTATGPEQLQHRLDL